MPSALLSEKDLESLETITRDVAELMTEAQKLIDSNDEKIASLRKRLIFASEGRLSTLERLMRSLEETMSGIRETLQVENEALRKENELLKMKLESADSALSAMELRLNSLKHSVDAKLKQLGL